MIYHQMSGFKLHRLGQIMEPESGNPMEVEGVLLLYTTTLILSMWTIRTPVFSLLPFPIMPEKCRWLSCTGHFSPEHAPKKLPGMLSQGWLTLIMKVSGYLIARYL